MFNFYVSFIYVNTMKGVASLVFALEVASTSGCKKAEFRLKYFFCKVDCLCEWNSK